MSAGLYLGTPTELPLGSRQVCISSIGSRSITLTNITERFRIFNVPCILIFRVKSAADFKTRREYPKNSWAVRSFAPGCVSHFHHRCLPLNWYSFLLYICCCDLSIIGIAWVHHDLWISLWLGKRWHWSALTIHQPFFAFLFPLWLMVYLFLLMGPDLPQKHNPFPSTKLSKSMFVRFIKIALLSI